MAGSDAAPEVIKRHEALKSARQVEEGAYREISRLLTPDEKDFDSGTQSEMDMADIFDATPLYALDDFAGGMFGQAMNPASRWFEIGLDDEDLAKWGPVRDHLWQRENVIYASLSPGVSNFYSEAPAWMANIGAFGWGPFWQEEMVGKGRILDRSMPIGEFFLDVDADGELDRVHRQFMYTGAQIQQKFPGYGSDCVEDRRYLMVHALSRNPDFIPGELGPKGMEWQSVYCSPDKRDFRVDGAYFELPTHIPMWKKRSGRAYPTGPGHRARPDMSSLQEMERSHLVAAQFAAEPPILLHDDSVLSAADIVPNALLHGTMNDNGKQLMGVLQRGQNLQLSMQQSEQRRAAIRSAFYFSIMQLVNRPQMTATEFLGFHEEQLRLMGPNLVRIQTGGLSPFIVRRNNILDRAGQIPPPPAELRGKRLKVNYISPLAKAQRAADGRAVLQFHGAIEQMAVTDPSVRDNFDADVGAQVVHGALSVVPGLLRDPQRVAEIRKARQAGQQEAMQLEQAGQAAKIAAEVAHGEQASSLARGRVQ